MREIVEDYLRYVARGEDGTPTRLHLRAFEALTVVVDPYVGFGQPKFGGSGARVADVAAIRNQRWWIQAELAAYKAAKVHMFFLPGQATRQDLLDAVQVTLTKVCTLSSRQRQVSGTSTGVRGAWTIEEF